MFVTPPLLCVVAVFWTRLEVKSRPVFRPPRLLRWRPAAAAAATPIFSPWDTQTSLTSSMSPTRWESTRIRSLRLILGFIAFLHTICKDFNFFKDLPAYNRQHVSLCCFLCIRNSETWRWGRLRGSAVDTESECCRLTKTPPKKMLWADRQFKPCHPVWL